MPEWQTVFNILGLIGSVVGVPSIILYLLQRKDANKKLEIDEGGLSVTKFDSLNKAYQDLLDRANGATTAALTELGSYKRERADIMKELEKLREDRDSQSTELDHTNSKLDKLRKLFQSVIARTGVTLTAEELEIFEDTKPGTRRRARTT